MMPFFPSSLKGSLTILGSPERGLRAFKCLFQLAPVPQPQASLGQTGSSIKGGSASNRMT